MPPRDIIFQTSTIDALLAGVYDGDMTCQCLLKHSDLGIGTFDRLDGELVLLDGRIYQVKADGKIYLPDPSLKTPFATVCSFSPEKLFSISNSMDYDGITALIDRTASNQNLFCAIRITGQFKAVKTRSVPRQSKPYPLLREVTVNQPEFSLKDITGTIIGFRCPAYARGINVPGYHMHFISADRKQGGHVLNCELINGKCELEELSRYFLRLPEHTKEFSEKDLSKDRTKELKDVERGGGKIVQ